MAKLSVIIPSRDERFLTPTIDDIFRNARGEVEVIAILDSDKWPADWKEVTDRHPNLHTIHNGSPRGMRHSINAGVASAKSRGAKFIMKSDGHCSFSEGFDEVLKADCADEWIVIPRRGRLDPESWTATETQKPDVDYHYLSFPDDPNDFGGPGLNGKIWPQRAVERASYELDEEMSSQGSCWFTTIDHFYRLELMDEAHYGPFWSEMQELGLKCWLSGGRVMVNKKCKYLHLHKGSKYGRGYRLPEAWLQQGASFTKLWIWNEAWEKQTKPFSWLIEHFWPVPTWPENWREVLYANRRPRAVAVAGHVHTSPDGDTDVATEGPMLKIHKAHYGVGSLEDIDVRERLQSLVKDNSLDIIVNNSTLTPNSNPFRGKKKRLNVTYSIDGGDTVTATREEKDWLIVGPVGTLGSEETARLVSKRDGREDEVRPRLKCAICGRLTDSLMAPIAEANEGVCSDGCAEKWIQQQGTEPIRLLPQLAPMTAAALNDYLIRRFQISPQRLRGPMPIELRDFHRNDLAQLFAELGFNYGAEIGVAEANYSEVLMKANPTMKLLCVDPWHAYSSNPQNKSKEKHEYAFNQAKQKLAAYHNVEFIVKYSMDAVRGVDEESLDFCYIDANHLFDYAMQDLIEWSKRVRSGGIVSGDDFYQLDQKRWVGGGVVEAVQAYTNAHRIPLWFLFAGHKSVDYLWVKP